MAISLFVAVLAAEGLFELGAPEVRIDSGDRRRRGILFSWPEAPVPGRKHLVKIAAECGIPPEWHRPPFAAPSYPDQGRYYQYSRAAWWAEHEPGIGKVILRQFAAYHQHPPAESGYPLAALFLSMLEWDEQKSCYSLCDVSRSSWDEEQLRTLLKMVEYSPPPGSVIAGRLVELSERAKQSP